jgi:hypothetical protein
MTSGGAREDWRRSRERDREDWTRRREAERGDAALRPGRGGPFAAVVEKLVRGCGQQGAEFDHWPFDAIAQIVASFSLPPRDRLGIATSEYGPRWILFLLLRDIGSPPPESPRAVSGLTVHAASKVRCRHPVLPPPKFSQPAITF